MVLSVLLRSVASLLSCNVSVMTSIICRRLELILNSLPRHYSLRLSR